MSTLTVLEKEVKINAPGPPAHQYQKIARKGFKKKSECLQLSEKNHLIVNVNI